MTYPENTPSVDDMLNMPTGELAQMPVGFDPGRQDGPCAVLAISPDEVIEVRLHLGRHLPAVARGAAPADLARVADYDLPPAPRQMQRGVEAGEP